LKKLGVILFCFLWAAAALANPPMKVISSTSSTTRFDMKWPYHTVTTYNAAQTKPYYSTGRILYLVTHEDVSKYRHFYPQNTCWHEWGYFFPKGTILCSHRPARTFGPPDYYVVEIHAK
jgi:hypothetical protein